MKKTFKKKQHSRIFFLSLSLTVHSVLILLLYLNTKDLWPFFKKDIHITSSSIRVDMVGLPDLISKKSPSSIKKVKSKPIKTKKKEKKDPVKSSLKKDLQKPKPKPKKIPKPEPLPEKKTISQEPPSPAPEPKTKKEEPAPSHSEQELLKGNKVKQGEDQGEERDFVSESMSALHLYTRAMKRKIKAHWNLPKYLVNTYLTAQIEIRINEQGHVVYKQIVLSSGNDMFDSYVLKAIEDSAPYPSLPENIRDLVKEGIVFNLDSQ